MFGSFAASPAFKGVLYVIKMHKVMALGTIPGKGPSGKNPGVVPINTLEPAGGIGRAGSSGAVGLQGGTAAA